MNSNDTFIGNYAFIVATTDDGAFVAHRPVEPAFLVVKDTEEKAIEFARAIIGDYISKFTTTEKTDFFDKRPAQELLLKDIVSAGVVQKVSNLQKVNIVQNRIHALG